MYALSLKAVQIPVLLLMHWLTLLVYHKHEFFGKHCVLTVMEMLSFDQARLENLFTNPHMIKSEILNITATCAVLYEM